MTFRTIVNAAGQIQLGDAAIQAGFSPGQRVEVIKTGARGTLLVTVDDSHPIDVPYHVASPNAPGVLAEGGARR